MSKAKGSRKQSNDQRANAKNPNNPAFKAASDNRANQLNPNNPAAQKSQQGNKKVAKSRGN